MDAFEGHNKSSGIFAGAFPQGPLRRERPLPGNGTPVHISRPRCADPGGKKGGVAPVHLRFPRSARRSREYGRNSLREKEIVESGSVNRRDRYL